MGNVHMHGKDVVHAERLLVPGRGEDSQSSPVERVRDVEELADRVVVVHDGQLVSSQHGGHHRIPCLVCGVLVIGIVVRPSRSLA